MIFPSAPDTVAGRKDMRPKRLVISGSRILALCSLCAAVLALASGSARYAASARSVTPVQGFVGCGNRIRRLPQVLPSVVSKCADSTPDGTVSSDTEDEHVSFYTILGVQADVTPEDLRLAYRKAARESHPDLAEPGEARENAQARFELVSQAYRTLSDPQLKDAYDLRGLAGLAELLDNGERTIMPPPWRVRVGHTGHHFWKRKDYFVGFVLETVDLPLADVHAAYEEATKDPVGVGQAVLVQKCTERRAKDIVEAFSEFGLVCLAEEIPEEELYEYV